MRVKKAALIGLASLLLCGCSSQEIAKEFGGSVELYLEPNEKLEEITWKDDALWYLVKDMTEDDVAEVHYFKKRGAYGGSGLVTVYEYKVDEDTLEDYREFKKVDSSLDFNDYEIYKEHGYTADDVRYGRVDYTIFNESSEVIEYEEDTWGYQ